MSESSLLGRCGWRIHGVEGARSRHHTHFVFIVFLLKTLDRFFDLLACLF